MGNLIDKWILQARLGKGQKIKLGGTSVHSIQAQVIGQCHVPRKARCQCPWNQIGEIEFKRGSQKKHGLKICEAPQNLLRILNIL